MAAYWEIAADLAYDMIFKYSLPNGQFIFSPPRFWSGGFLIAPFPVHCKPVPFPNPCSARENIYTERNNYMKIHIKCKSTDIDTPKQVMRNFNVLRYNAQ